MKLRIRMGALAGAVVVIFSLAGCVGMVPMAAAPEANSPECAAVSVRLPDVVAELPQRETSAQATGAWGEPAAVLVRCGVEVPGPTTMPCVAINDVDWIEDDSEAPLYRYTTYGREPAVEVVIDSDAVSGSTVLVDLSGAVRVLPSTGQCLGAADVYSN